RPVKVEITDPSPSPTAATADPAPSSAPDRPPAAPSAHDHMPTFLAIAPV
ncbi:hypothetical protein I552_0271, partial [Mycobacterium xenopi 3993]